MITYREIEDINENIVDVEIKFDVKHGELEVYYITDKDGNDVDMDNNDYINLLDDLYEEWATREDDRQTYLANI